MRAPGGITGSGSVVVVDNASDNKLMAFRFKLPQVKMQAAEARFDAGGHHFGAGTFIIADANVAQLGPVLRDLGLAAWAMPSAPAVKAHDLTVPRIGYVHSWQRTQDEGWVRAALDYYGVPYTYFGEPVLKTGNLRAKYDVIIYPHGGSGAAAAPAGRGGPGGGGGDARFHGGWSRARRCRGETGPLPANCGVSGARLPRLDRRHQRRCGAGRDEGAVRVRAAGRHADHGGQHRQHLPEPEPHAWTQGGNATGLFANGTILRGLITDKRSPLVYGYEYG